MTIYQIFLIAMGIVSYVFVGIVAARIYYKFKRWQFQSNGWEFSDCWKEEASRSAVVVGLFWPISFIIFVSFVIGWIISLFLDLCQKVVTLGDEPYEVKNFPTPPKDMK